MSQEDFLHVSDHYALLAAKLSGADLQAYRKLQHVRPETAYLGRTFIVYKVVDREPIILDQLVVQDFHCNEEDGASTELWSKMHGDSFTVGYEPKRVRDYDIFVHLPLHTKLRWSATRQNLNEGSLAFDLVIRTVSRLNQRERGVVHMETGVRFGQEFEGAPL